MPCRRPACLLLLLAAGSLPALPAAADWERLRPVTEAPPQIRPETDAVCREKARLIDEGVRRAEATAGSPAAGVVIDFIPEETRAERRWFYRRCFVPRLCPAYAGGPLLTRFTVSEPYERLIRLCGQQDGENR